MNNIINCHFKNCQLLGIILAVDEGLHLNSRFKCEFKIKSDSQPTFNPGEKKVLKNLYGYNIYYRHLYYEKYQSN